MPSTLLTCDHHYPPKSDYYLQVESLHTLPLEMYNPKALPATGRNALVTLKMVLCCYYYLATFPT